MPIQSVNSVTSRNRRRRIISALGRWIDSYVIWHSPALAIAVLRAMDERRGNSRLRNRVCEDAIVECCGQYLAAGCTGAK